MGFSTSGATAIIFIGLLVSFGSVYPVVESSLEEVHSARDRQDDSLLRQQNTAIQVQNVTYNASTDTATITVDNTGSTTLETDRTDVLLDGVYRQPATVAVDNTTGRTVWTPASRLEITIVDVTEAPSRVKIVTGPGVSDIRVS
jgi:flagellar protein FlaF